MFSLPPQAFVLATGSISITLSVYCALIVTASLFGGYLPNLVKLTHKRMQLLISFVGGLMLGIGLFHMLPHALAELGPVGLDRTMISVMAGMVVTFFLLRMFHFHHHEPPELPDDTVPEHDHAHDHGGHEGCSHGHGEHSHAHQNLSWLGVFIGLSLHTMLDGIALGASMRADEAHGFSTLMMGLGTFLAILLHKPLDAISITALMRAGKWPTRTQFIVNGTFALMCPLGAMLFLLGTSTFIEQQPQLVGTVLAFSAGVFLCISLSDLLPEMEFHSHHRVPLSLALLAGIVLAWCIRYLEPQRAHQFLPPPAVGINAEPEFRESPQNP
ncbi:MAG: ZIP family metal transporter [Planctomycetaceae bacterium]|nr:ZIP family metal transporter [Planctomycetaceae bacterium]